MSASRSLASEQTEERSNRNSAHGPSFLRWAGSKRQSLAHLQAIFSDPKYHYIEPFAGSAALFFALMPRSATLADLNGHLINSLRQVRDHPRALYNRLLKQSRTKSEYYRLRSAFNQMHPFGLQAAALFVYLNRNCFNGLWRTNAAGEFNVPYGGAEMGDNPPLSLFEDCSAALKRATLRHQDFRKTLREADKDTFIYADPPYFTATERVFVEYGRKSFDEKDLEELIDQLVLAADKGAHVVLTYNGSVKLRGIPRSWKRKDFQVTRNVGGFAGTRKKQTETLYTNRSI